MRLRFRWGIALSVVGVVLSCVWLIANQPPRQAVAAQSQSVPINNLARDTRLEPGVSNEYCLECHGKPDQIRELPSGEPLYLTVDSELFAASVHGAEGYACVQCHTAIREYPHAESTAQDRRDVTLQMAGACKDCHANNYEKTADSVHQKAQDAGERNAAVCSDCHNPHEQPRLNIKGTEALFPEARVHIPQTCARCHSEIYNTYKQSVHGAALTKEGNPDVPTCIDCHGVHDIADPTTVEFRLNSPQMCAKCHTDPERMDKYKISTHVLDTYLADFHGTTVTLFQKNSPDQQTNKPVCFDCHGIHDIASADDPEKGLQVKENLLATCQKCHPDATSNFPDSWLSHYVPSPEKNPLVYYVELFYQFFVPGVLGGMAIFVVADAWRRFGRPRLGKR